MTKKQKYYTDALNKLKDKRGPVPHEFDERRKDLGKMYRAIKKFIEKNGETDLPAIREELPYEPHLIYHLVNVMMKYDGLHVANKRGEYPTYKF